MNEDVSRTTSNDRPRSKETGLSHQIQYISSIDVKNVQKKNKKTLKNVIKIKKTFKNVG